MNFPMHKVVAQFAGQHELAPPSDRSDHLREMGIIAHQLIEDSLDRDATREAKLALAAQIRIARQQADRFRDRLDAVGLERARIEREAATTPAE